MREGSDSCILGFLYHLENNTPIPGCGSSIPSLCAPITHVRHQLRPPLRTFIYTIKISDPVFCFLFFPLLSILSDPEHPCPPPPPTERLLQRLHHDVTLPGFTAKLVRERTMERDGKNDGGLVSREEEKEGEEVGEEGEQGRG